MLMDDTNEWASVTCNPHNFGPLPRDFQHRLKSNSNTQFNNIKKLPHDDLKTLIQIDRLELPVTETTSAMFKDLHHKYNPKFSKQTLLDYASLDDYPQKTSGTWVNTNQRDPIHRHATNMSKTRDHEPVLKRSKQHDVDPVPTSSTIQKSKTSTNPNLHDFLKPCTPYPNRLHFHLQLN